MIYAFADCVLDVERHQFTRSGEVIEIEPQVFDLLTLLAENPARLVHKDKMMERVWGGRIVSEATISSRISAARAAVGDNGKEQRIIKTIPRRGIELIASVEVEGLEISPKTSNNIANQKIRFSQSFDGTNIAYAISGQGPALMRMGHFLTHLEKEWNSIIWRPYLEALSRHHSLVRFDLRLTGLSDRDATDLSLEAYAADMIAVADAAGLERFPVVAASQSVPIAIYDQVGLSASAAWFFMEDLLRGAFTDPIKAPSQKPRCLSR